MEAIIPKSMLTGGVECSKDLVRSAHQVSCETEAELDCVRGSTHVLFPTSRWLFRDKSLRYTHASKNTSFIIRNRCKAEVAQKEGRCRYTREPPFCLCIFCA